MEYVTLNNGVKMPILGYGVYQTPADITEECVHEALEIGYRSIDTAQVALRFLIQSDVVVIPKSVHKNRMQENFDVFDFALTDEEMKKIQNLDEGSSAFFSHYDTKTVEQFMEWAR